MRSITFIQCAPTQSHFSLTLMPLSYYRNETKRVEGGGWFELYIFGGRVGEGLVKMKRENIATTRVHNPTTITHYLVSSHVQLFVKIN